VIFLRYEVRLVFTGGKDSITHRRFMTHDGASYCAGRFRTASNHLVARVYDRKRQRYL
jgi:hypothetical protein